MLTCEIAKGYLYYGETKHRTEVEFSDSLRDEVRQITKEMHQLYQKRYTPKVKTGSFCKSCSLNEICLPILCKNRSASEYIKRKIEAET